MVTARSEELTASVDQETLMAKETEREINAALNALMAACGIAGESGMERMFWVLQEAVQTVADNWDIVERSHEDGLCYDVNALLSDAIAVILQEQAASSGANES
jgi:hypothetical protein